MNAPARKRRLLILVDGVFFQAAMRKARIHYHIDFPRLARMLPSKVEDGCLLVKLNFYIAESPDPETRRREQALFEALRDSTSTDLVLGWHDRRRCRRCGNEYHREKGTDVSIATDLVVGAYKDVYDSALLITGDEDYVSAIKAARQVDPSGGQNPEWPKRVIWGHFGTQATDGKLAQAADASFLLDDKFLRTVERVNVSPHRRR